MKTINTILLFLIIVTQTMFAQETSLDTIEFKATKYPKFYIETGIHIPVDALSKVIKPSPFLGFWYRNEFQKDNFVEFGCTIFIPIKEQNFTFKVPDTLIKTKPEGVSGMVGFRFNKLYHPSQNENFTLEWKTSFGYAFFMYDANYHRYLNQLEDPNSNKPDTRAFSTIHTGMGIKINYKNVGCLVHYQWTPYHLFSDYIDKKFGAQAVQIGIFYRQ